MSTSSSEIVLCAVAEEEGCPAAISSRKRVYFFTPSALRLGVFQATLLNSRDTQHNTTYPRAPSHHIMPAPVSE